MRNACIGAEREKCREDWAVMWSFDIPACRSFVFFCRFNVLGLVILGN